MTSERGFAVILVIWALAVMTTIAAGFALAVRHETRVAQDGVTELESDAAMTAALSYAIYQLNLRDADRRWLADGHSHSIPTTNVSTTVTVRSEGAKIDINRAPRQLLEGLIAQLLPDAPVSQLVDALIDWRDRDDDVSPEGAEENEYRSAGYSYGPANDALRSVHELGQVMGFDADRMAALLPYLTVYSRSPRINALGADLLTLSAVPGISRADAERFIAERELAMAAGQKVSLDTLRESRRYLDMRVDSRVINMEIETRLQDTAPRKEQFVIQLRSDGYYEILAHETPARDTEQSL